MNSQDDQTPSIEQLDKIEKQLKVEELQLKVSELKLRINDIQKPTLKRINTWTSLLAVVIAFGSVIGQNIWSNIKIAKAELDFRETQIKKDSTEKALETAVLKLKRAQENQLEAEKRERLSLAEIDTLNTFMSTLSKFRSTLTEKDISRNPDLDKLNTLLKKSEKIISKVYVTKIVVKFETSKLEKTFEANLFASVISPKIENEFSYRRFKVRNIPGLSWDLTFDKDELLQFDINESNLTLRFEFGDPTTWEFKPVVEIHYSNQTIAILNNLAIVKPDNKDGDIKIPLKGAIRRGTLEDFFN